MVSCAHIDSEDAKDAADWRSRESAPRMGGTAIQNARPHSNQGECVAEVMFSGMLRLASGDIR